MLKIKLITGGVLVTDKIIIFDVNGTDEVDFNNTTGNSCINWMMKQDYIIIPRDNEKIVIPMRSILRLHIEEN